jgi:hypothetical protein
MSLTSHPSGIPSYLPGAETDVAHHAAQASEYEIDQARQNSRDVASGVAVNQELDDDFKRPPYLHVRAIRQRSNMTLTT